MGADQTVQFLVIGHDTIYEPPRKLSHFIGGRIPFPKIIQPVLRITVYIPLKENLERPLP
jgi:hypothetical protein